MLHRLALDASFVWLAQAAAVQRPFDLTALQQPESTGPTDFPYRPLPWGELNVLHTTDTHGWLLGHQRQEPSYSGDWGDFYSFVARMKEQARERGVDLLLVDTGDRVDGNGLVDAEPEGHVTGWTAMKYFSEVPYDALTTGNHELYRYPQALSTFENLAQTYEGKYLTSNVNITINQGVNARSVVSGSRYRKFKTEMGRNVTAFGSLFEFKGHAPGITVQAPHEMVKESWFQDAIQEKPDVFLLIGHMTLRGEPDSEWSVIHQAIRIVHPDVPILIFGGHHHIRDCAQEDPRSMSLASGRYMETIGFMSVSGLTADPSQPLDLQRRYLDQNRNTYIYHAGPDFDTARGKEISLELGKVASSFNITTVFGTAPQNYWQSRHSHTSPNSIQYLLAKEVLPKMIKNPRRETKPVVFLNTGSVRFDIFKGPFTRNTQWIIMPFANEFVYIPNVSRKVAAKILDYLNLVGEHGLLPHQLTADAKESLSFEELRALDDARVERVYHRNLAQAASDYVSAQADEKASLGYVTLDSCADKGDDTLHRPMPSVWQPTFVSTDLPDEELVDVVFFDFLIVDLVGALNHLQTERQYSSGDVKLYTSELRANTLMEKYASAHW